MESVLSLPDITKSGPLLEATLDAVSDAVLVIGFDGKILASNGKFREYFGISSNALRCGAVEAVKCGLERCFERSELFPEKWSQMFQKPPLVKVEWKIKQPVQRTLELTAVPVGDERAMCGTVFVWHEVTEANRMKMALQQAEKMESIGMLAGGIAHDFNNVLTAVTGNISLAIEQISTGHVSADTVALLAAASQAAMGGRDLVKRLMSHARRSVPRVESFDIGALASDVRGLLKSSISPLILVELLLPKSLWQVHADRSSIQQVILNLCVNAVDAMKGQPSGMLAISASNHPAGSPELAEKGKPGMDYVMLEICDSGPGIPPEVMPHIFEPLFTTKPPGEGTGLGLANCREILERHDGWIECESTPGQGATFRAFLPRGAVEAKTSAKPKPSKPASAAKTRCTERILVVDDDVLVRTVNAQLLTAAGFKVATANDGIEALEWINTPGNEADLVLLDMAMPRLSGVDTMREIRRLKPGLPVVLCSGSLTLANPSAFKDLTCAPPDAKLSKPYDVAELTRTMRQVLDSARRVNGKAPQFAERQAVAELSA